MARTLPAAISSALAAGVGAQPSISITSTDLQLRYSLLASTGFAKLRNAAILSSAGSVIRAAVTQGADPNTVTVYRIPTPSSAANWSAAAIATLSTNAMATGGVCLVQSGSTIRCFWIDATSKCPKYCDSTNDGLTWGAAQTTLSVAPPTTSLCYGIMAASTTDIICSYQAFSYGACTWSRTTFSAGAWQAWQTALGPATTNLGNSWGPVRGLSMDATNATHVFLTGAILRFTVSGYAAASTTYSGDPTVAANWSSLSPIHDMDTPSNGLSYQWPTVHFNSADGFYYATVTLADDGTVSGSVQNRTNIWRSVDGIAWQLMGAAGTAFSYEAHTLVISGTTYVFDNASVYSAPGAPGPTDLTADVLALSIVEASRTSTRFTLTLSNAQGQYLSLSNLRDNCTLQIALGCNGTTIPTHTAYVDAVRHQAVGSSLITIVEARDLQKLLEQISPRLIPYTSSTPAAIASGITTLAGVTLGTLPATSQFSQTIPCFVLAQGESYDNALKRLSSVYDFDFFVTGAPSVFLKITERQAADASSWSYGQETLAAAIQTDADQANIIRVIGLATGGTNIFAEVTDAANMQATGLHRLKQIVDRMLDTAARCTLKGQLALRDEQTSATTVQLTVTLNPAHELMDVITLSDSRLGLTSQPYRIHEIHTDIDFTSGTWLQHLTCHLP